MYANLWSVLLIAFVSQCIFLIASLSVRPSANQKAGRLLIVLLAIFLSINLSNLAEAIYLYHKIHGITNLGRGMVLLLGPVLYLYELAILKPTFRLRASHLLHLIPYLTAIILIRIQERSVSDQTIIATIDSLMEGKLVMTWEGIAWFVSYFTHLSVYILIIRKEIVNSAASPRLSYIIPLEQRLAWLKKLMMAFGLVVAVFFGIIIYIMVTGLYTISGNFIYTMSLGLMVYLIAFQAISNKHTLKPDFATKYNSKKTDCGVEEQILLKVLQLFEHEKVFLDPELKIAGLAKKAGITSHEVSRIMNEKLNKNFNELVNYYRIKEFKTRLNDQKYTHYSIMGIAYDVGFNNKSSFNEAFKKQNGLTPSEYLRHRKI